jgi:hypothetical protein
MKNVHSIKKANDIEKETGERSFFESLNQDLFSILLQLEQNYEDLKIAMEADCLKGKMCVDSYASVLAEDILKDLHGKILYLKAKIIRNWHR